MKHTFANLFTPRFISFILFLLIYSPNTFSQSLTAEQIYKKVSNAVVVVHAYNENNRLASQGSGVVLNDKGYVVTNYHVLAGNDRLEILHGKEVVPYVDIIGINVEKDILILKIDAKKFPAIKIGDSKKLNIGQRVYAVGSPMGLENSISEGIISGLRSIEESQRNFIQVTASISPGSSGGAVVNDKGELIGISTLTAKEGQNLNFAIPIHDVLQVKIGSYSKNNSFKDFEYFDKATRAKNSGDYYEAIKYYSLFLIRYPNYVDAFINRGLIKFYIEDYLRAIEDFDEVIEINQSDATLFIAYSNRGSAKIELNDNIGAIKDYNKAILLDPSIASGYYNRGNAKRNLEDYRGAISDYDSAIKIDPNYSSAFLNRGICRNQLKEYYLAIYDCDKAIQLNPNYALAFYNRGISKILLNDRNGACLDWSKAGELGLEQAYELIKQECK